MIRSKAVNRMLPIQIWSGRRVSNSRPQPWQGCALPTELLPRTLLILQARRKYTQFLEKCTPNKKMRHDARGRPGFAKGAPTPVCA